MEISNVKVGEVMKRRRTDQTKDLLKRSRSSPPVKLGRAASKAAKIAGSK